jgi:F-box-like/Leucine Rich repeat
MSRHNKRHKPTVENVKVGIHPLVPTKTKNTSHNEGTQNGGGMSKASNISTEILLMIFAFLKQSTIFNVIQVSKYWNSLAIPILWHKPCFPQIDLSPHAHHLKTYGKFVREMRIDDYKPSTENNVLLIINTCSNITSLNILLVYFKLEVFAMLCEGLPEMFECLSINHCKIIEGMSQSVPYITKLRNLKRFTWTECDTFGDDSCGQIVAGCTKLEYLDFTRTCVTDAGVRLIAQHLPRLCSLSVAYCHNITDASIIAIVESCPLLVSLDISRSQVTDNALIALASIDSSRCRETITHLNLSICKHITSVGVRQIVTRLTYLRTLIIRGCSSLSNDLFGDPSWKCTELAELDISFINIESSTLFFISNMMALTSLDIRELKGEVSSDAILSLASLPKLRRLNVQGNNFVDDHIAKKIAENCSFLRALALQHTNVSETCLEELRRLYPKSAFICE